MNQCAVILKCDRQSGFTLLELSVALVVIALVIGGVLVGRDMVRAAAIRTQIQQIEEYNTAVGTFQAKYNCLPGDCTTATRLFGQDSNNCLPIAHTFSYLNGTCNGDGNGSIGSGCAFHSDSTQCSESLQFWQMLSLAGLIKEGHFARPTVPVPGGTPGLNLPLLKIRGGAGIELRWFTSCCLFVNYPDFTNRHVYALGVLSASETLSSNALTANESRAIDTKLDDGLANRGDVRTSLNDHANCASAATGQYVNSDDVQASFGWTIPGCYMLIAAPF